LPKLRVVGMRQETVDKYEELFRRTEDDSFSDIFAEGITEFERNAEKHRKLIHTLVLSADFLDEKPDALGQFIKFLRTLGEHPE
jgi:hypothetical protein